MIRRLNLGKLKIVSGLPDEADEAAGMGLLQACGRNDPTKLRRPVPVRSGSFQLGGSRERTRSETHRRRAGAGCCQPRVGSLPMGTPDYKTPHYIHCNK